MALEPTQHGNVTDTVTLMIGFTSQSTEWVKKTTGYNGMPPLYACSESAHIQALKKTGRYLWLVFGTLIIVCGTLGNCFTLAVLNSKHFKVWASATVFILSVLAVVDTTMLLISLEDWIRMFTEGKVDLPTMGSVICRTRLWLASAIGHVSSWTLVIVTVQRAILVCVPAQAKKVCTTRNTIISWVGVTIFWLLWNAHYFWTTFLFKKKVMQCENGYWTPGELAYCKPNNDNVLGIREDVSNWSNLITISVLPATIICLSNASILWTLARQSARLHSKNNSTPSGSRKGNTRRSSMTRILVVLSTMFLLSTLPWAIFFARNIDWFKTKERLTPTDLARFDLASEIVTLVFLLNNASNFFLYVLSGPSFRKAFVAVVCRKTESGMSSSNNPESSMSV